MKSSIRTFVLTAFAAVAILATSHSASAQVFSSNASGNHALGAGPSGASVMVLALPYAGTYMLGGQQLIFNQSNQSEYVYCWVSTTNGGSTPVTYGPLSGAVIPVGGALTLPLGGSYTATGPTDLWVVCRNSSAAGTVALATVGNFTALYW